MTDLSPEQLDEWLLATQGGDVNAFERYYEALFPHLRRFIFNKTGDKSLAEDIVSETFSKIYVSLPSFDPEKGNAKTWSFTIAYNTMISHLRKNRPIIYPEYNESDLIEDDTKSPLEYTQQRIQHEKINTFLDGLDSTHRQILLMRVRDGLSYDEISGIVGHSSAACKQIYYRTTKLLATRLGGIVLLLGIIAFFLN